MEVAHYLERPPFLENPNQPAPVQHMQIFKVGTFFMVIGVIILVLFAGASRADVDGTNGLLFWGLLFFILGFFLWRRFPAPPPGPSNRFRILKRGRKHNGSRNGEDLEDDRDKRD